ncbi:MAG: hypothetical protein EOL97_09580 [Spirochaetia bacterium]|nr:hypothetical protein [Spirochaetia bacterium]
MVDTSTADLKNALASVDKYNTEFKNFTNYFKFDELYSTKKSYDADGYFKVMTDPLLASVTNGTDVTVDEFEDMLIDTRVFNTLNKSLVVLTTNSMFETLDDWNFDFDNEEITIGINDLISYNLVNNTNINYTTATITIYNENSDINTNCTYYLVTDSAEIEIESGNKYTFTITNTLKLKITSSLESTSTTNMFSSLGRPMLIYIEYN